MSNVDVLLGALQKVRKVGQDKWIGCCAMPDHNDKNPSTGVTLKPDGTILIRCFGCGANGLDIVNALGLEPSILFPQSDNPKYEKQNRYGFSAWQLLHALEKDLLVVLIAINRYLIEGERPCQSDVDYLTDVCKRINEALQYLEGRRND